MKKKKEKKKSLAQREAALNLGTFSFRIFAHTV